MLLELADLVIEGFRVELAFSQLVSCLCLELCVLHLEGLVLCVDDVGGGLLFPQFQYGLFQNVNVGLELLDFLVFGFYLFLCTFECLFAVFDFGAVEFGLGEAFGVAVELGHR